MRKPEDPDDAALAAIELVTAPAADGNGEGRYEPMGQAIARRVRDAILDGRLTPGARIRQQALARRFGVSRIPVREALRQLETEGLVILVPHSGARVARLDLAEHLEIYRIREALEPLALAESAPLLSDAQLDQLRALAREVHDTRGDAQRWLDADRRLHLASYAAAPLPRLLTMIEGFWNTTQHYRRAYLSTLDERHHDLVDAEHELIIDALERRDPIDAEARQRSHIRRTRITLAAHAELFDDR